MVYAREREKKNLRNRETLSYAFVPEKWRELYCAHMADKEKSIIVSHTQLCLSIALTIIFPE
jgi:hypothetical protein